LPPGRRFPINGVRANTSPTSSMVNAMPASLAMAGRCSAALVEPPVAATIAAPFSNDLRVMISRGSGPLRASISSTSRPARRATWARSGYTPGIIDTLGTVRPMASDTIPMVLAVNCPAQAPIVGRHDRSIPVSVASSTSPVMNPPTAS